MHEMLGANCRSIWIRDMDATEEREEDMLDALEIWLWRRMAEITREMKITNESVLQEIGVERELLRTLLIRK